MDLPISLKTSRMPRTIWRRATWLRRRLLLSVWWSSPRSISTLNARRRRSASTLASTASLSAWPIAAWRRYPRELVQVEVPFDRLYSDMAFAYIRQQDYVSARNALMQAVRWDPMNCNYRLDLAELFRALEDNRNGHRSRSRCWSVRAMVSAPHAPTPILGQYFLEPETENISAAVGCARLALRLAPNDAHTTRLLNKIHTTYPDAADESDDHVMGELALQGVPTSPSAEIAICLIMCATDAASDGDKQEATRSDGPCPRPGGRGGMRGDYQAGARERCRA